MLRLLFAVIYTALTFGANGAAAGPAEARTLLAGDMKKLVIHAEARPLPEVTLADLDEAPRSLSDWRGRWVVANFWATWCAPCREEMPTLDRLEAEMGGEGFSVVTVATGRNAVPGIRKFFEEAEVTHLPVLRDPKSALARQIGVMGLPVTLVLDPEGREVARLIGDADWDSPEAMAVLGALMQ
ncbi:TlpA family protein disulfide reductase [Cereibacter azotoformans]|uniref:TlpA family protein disulfide reductase n=1 Tax=Cereibacter azotoformans TaxID=43057 RepID=UPI000C6E2971|nr:TlpA disulfide reductase family protein [Cereibacter azotoformans]